MQLDSVITSEEHDNFIKNLELQIDAAIPKYNWKVMVRDPANNFRLMVFLFLLFCIYLFIIFYV